MAERRSLEALLTEDRELTRDEAVELNAAVALGLTSIRPGTTTDEVFSTRDDVKLQAYPGLSPAEAMIACNDCCQSWLWPPHVQPDPREIDELLEEHNVVCPPGGS